MAENTQKKKKENSSKSKSKRRLDIAPKFIADNIVFSEKEQWAFYRVQNSFFDFLDDSAKIAGASRLASTFEALMRDRPRPLSCYLLLTSDPVDIDSWRQQMMDNEDNLKLAPGFEKYVKDQYEYLQSFSFSKKIVYFGIKLGNRNALEFNPSSVFDAGFKDAIDTAKKTISSVMNIKTEYVTKEEELMAREKEMDFNRILANSEMGAERATADEILLAIKRQFFPAMPTPYLNVDYDSRIGSSDIEKELSSAIFNNLRWMRINQMTRNGKIVDGYRAALTVSKLPREVEFPYNWPFLYFKDFINRNSNIYAYARFNLIPSEKMKKNFEKQKARQKDEFENMKGGDVNSSLGVLDKDIEDSLDDIQKLNVLIQDRTPWFEGVYRLVITASTEEELKKRCTEVINKYDQELDIKLSWTIGDQKNLFLEQMMGDTLREKDHQQITDVKYLSTSGFAYANNIGDPIKPPNHRNRS